MVVEGFGVQEHLPTGLASQVSEVTGQDVLYIVGRETCKLYYLNPEQGRAHYVNTYSDVPSFGVGIASPADLTSHRGTLYMIDDYNGELVSLDVTDGKATPLGDMHSLGIVKQLPKGIASYGDKLYLVCDNRGTVNGPMGPTGAVLEPSQSTSILYELTETGAQERINISKFFPGIWPSGLFVVNEILCMATQNSPHVYILDVDNGRALAMDSTNTPLQLVFPKFPNIRADLHEGFLYVVGRADKAKLQAFDEKGREMMSVFGDSV